MRFVASCSSLVTLFARSLAEALEISKQDGQRVHSHDFEAEANVIIMEELAFRL